MITKKNPIAITVDVAATGAIRSIKKLTGALGGIGLGAGAAVAGISVLGGAMGVATAAAMRHAAKLELIQNKTSIVFGEQLPIIKRWSEETAASFGLTAINLEGMAAGFQDLLIPMGFARDEAAQMTMDVVGLAGAMSEWSAGTRSVEDTTRILARAMLGEREMLKDLGVDIRELDIKQRLMAKGQEELTGNMLKQARAVATMEMIFERSKDAQAGFAKGGDSLTRTIRQMSARFQEMIQQMQIELTPSFKLLVDKITDEVIPKIEGELFPVIDDLIKGFAEKLPGAIDATLELFEEWGPSVGRAAEAAFDLATHLDDLFEIIEENRGAISTLLIIGGALFALLAGPGALALAAVGIGFKLAYDEAAELTEKNKGLRDGTKQLANELDAMIEQQDALNVAYRRAIEPTVEVTESFDQMAAAGEDYERQVIKAKNAVNAMTVSYKGLNQQQIATALATDLLTRQQDGQIVGFDQMNAEIQSAAILLRHYTKEQRNLESMIGTIQTVAGLAPLGRPAGGTTGGSGSGGSESDFAGYELQTFHTPPDHVKKEMHKLSKINMDEVARGMAHFELDLDAFMDPISKVTTNLGKIGRSIRLPKSNEIMPGDSNTFADAIDRFFVSLMEEFKLPQHAAESMAKIIKAQAIEQGIEEFGPVLRGNLPEIRPPVNEPGTLGFDIEKFLEEHEKKNASATPKTATVYNVTQNVNGIATPEVVEKLAVAFKDAPEFKEPGFIDEMFGIAQ